MVPMTHYNTHKTCRHTMGVDTVWQRCPPRRESESPLRLIPPAQEPTSAVCLGSGCCHGNCSSSGDDEGLEREKGGSGGRRTHWDVVEAGTVGGTIGRVDVDLWREVSGGHGHEAEADPSHCSHLLPEQKQP